MAATWTVVKFLKDNSVEAVPTRWIENGKCAWPNYTKERLMKAIRTSETASSSWNTHEIVPFRNATYDNYTIARQKSSKAEATSDLNSDSEKRKMRKPAHFESDEEVSAETSSDESEKNVEGDHSTECPQIIISQEISDMNINGELDLRDSRRNRIEKMNEQSGQDSVKENNPKESVGESHQSGSSGTSMNNCTCCQVHKHEIQYTTGLLKQIMRKITIMEMELSDIRTIMERRPVSIPEQENVWVNFNFPIANNEELKKFDEFLNDDDNMKKSAIELSKVGGNNANDFIKRSMSKILTNKLAEEFSWAGLKKKKIFSKLNIPNLLINAAQLNPNSSRDTEKDIEDAIKKVLRRAKERATAEEKRMEQIAK